MAKTFDNGMICASEQSGVVLDGVYDQVRKEFAQRGCYFLNEEWLDKVFERINRLDFGRIKSKYKSVKGKPKVAQQGTVHGATRHCAWRGAVLCADGRCLAVQALFHF